QRRGAGAKDARVVGTAQADAGGGGVNATCNGKGAALHRTPPARASTPVHGDADEVADFFAARLPGQPPQRVRQPRADTVDAGHGDAERAACHAPCGRYFFFLPPPSCLLTVAQAMRSADSSLRPFFFSLSSMCEAWRFCLSV